MENNLFRALTEQEKRDIEELAAVGASEEDIAAELKISAKHLQEQYSAELTYGSAKGKNEVLKTFYKQVQSGTNVGATTFWVKGRCGWRDTGSINVASTPNIAIFIEEQKPCPSQT